jgi:2-polyprenyl-6-methoxyphenol hydroxylase-like FAD-dependent oxidoreductase
MARILIVGGSLGGLLAANMLLRAGHDVQVLEKAEGSLDGRGAGIVTHAALSVALRRCGVPLDEALGVKVESRVALDAEGREVVRLHMPQVLTSWSRLYALLRRGFPDDRIHGGMTVTSVQQDDAGVQVTAQNSAPNGANFNGTNFNGDLLIASDGLRSAVRAQFAPLSVPEYAGYIAWRGVCDEAVLSPQTLSSVFNHFGFGLPAGEQLIGYPVAGAHNTTEPGQRRWNFVWYRPAAAAELQDLLTDDDGVHHPLGIAPHRIQARHVAAMLEASRKLLAPQFVEIIRHTAQPFVQPIFDVASSRLVFNRVALMGDAAFVARPHVGMGVTKAAEDAIALNDSIRMHGATAAALGAFEAKRLPAGWAVVQRARQLGAYLQAQSQAGGNATSRDADAVLRDTAIDLGATRSSKDATVTEAAVQ